MSLRSVNPSGPADPNRRKFRTSLFTQFYEFLTRSDSVEPADFIFVLAGRMERKQYALELYRAQVAPRLILSVGRFEVSRMHTLNVFSVDDLKELVSLRDNTPAKDRSFFAHLDVGGTRFERSDLVKCSTYGEAFALRKFLKGAGARKVIVISTDVHLRRTALTFKTLFRDQPIEFRYCPVPSRLSFMTKHDWWASPDNRRFLLKEFAKLVGYWLILSMPDWVSRRLMSLDL
jgi:uncharacterized SAM-binding protein YcdF (DUF218 family)